MDPALCNDYKAVRDVILKEHKLSPGTYLDFFSKLTMGQNETTVMYCARLNSLLSMYVESRGVDSFDVLLSLIVSDRIKSTLSENCLRYVLSVEAATSKGWLPALELAECIDLYKANHLGNGRPRASAIGSGPCVRHTRGASANNSTVTTGQSEASRPPQQSKPVSAPGKDPSGGWQRPLNLPGGQPNYQNGLNPNVACFKCRVVGHTRKNRPLLRQTGEHRVNTYSKPKPSPDAFAAQASVREPPVVINEQRDVNASVNESTIIDKLSLEPDFVPLQYLSVADFYNHVLYSLRFVKPY